MDKANLALCQYLLSVGRSLHLVAQRIDEDLRVHTGVKTYQASTPLNSIFLGERNLAALAHQVAATVASNENAIVLSNGGNFAWPGVNWVHSLHHAWPVCDAGAPAAFRLRNRVTKYVARRNEKRALSIARLILANSHRTQQDIASYFPNAQARIETVYLGCDPAIAERNRDARKVRLSQPGHQTPTALFVGALGYDNNKGLDLLLDAWLTLAADESWDAKLLVAGGGRAVRTWEQRVQASAPLARSVSILGEVSAIGELYSRADLFVGPSRYEAYGLAAHEAICSGLSAIVTRSSGIAERFPDAIAHMLIPDPPTARALAEKLRVWRRDFDSSNQLFSDLRSELISHSWNDMAARIVALAEATL